MSSGPKKVKTTSETNPPDYLVGPLKTAASLATSQLGNNALQNNMFTSLDRQFNRAADLTRTRLSSEFAGAGRDLDAAYPARSDELQTLASSIYSPTNLLQFDPTNLLINRLAGLLPGAGGSTQSTQPVFRTGLF